MIPWALSYGRRSLLAIAVAGISVILLVTLTGVSPALAGSSSWWRLDSTSAPTLLPVQGEAQFIVTASNLGDQEVNATSEHVTLTDALPEGVRPIAVTPVGRQALSCPEHPSGQVVTCSFEQKLASYESLSMRITVEMEAPAQTPLVNVVKAEGGEIPPPSPLEKGLKLQKAADEQTPFGVETYEMTPETETGALDTLAGSHPFQLTTTLDLNQALLYYEHVDTPPDFGYFPSAPALPRNLRFKLPAGLVADASAVPQCSDVQFSTITESLSDLCPSDTALGVASVFLNLPVPLGFTRFEVPVFNLVPAPGEPARFGFEVHEVPIVLDTSLPSGGEYAAEASTSNTSQLGEVLGSRVTIWGVPGDPRHDSARGWECLENGVWEKARAVPVPCVPADESSPTAFLTLPTSCERPPVTGMSGSSWAAGMSIPEEKIEEGEPGTSYKFPSKLTGCETLEFDPTITVVPEQQSASTPTGLNVGVEMPQPGLLTGEGRAESALKETTVALPPGLEVNPSAANGLQACLEETEEIAGVISGGVGFKGFRALEPEGPVMATFTEAFDFIPPEDFTPPQQPKLGENFCSDASKVGTAHIKTPLLSGELEGNVYLAAQDANPFGTLVALYIVAQDKEAGVLVKLAGDVTLNEATGQLTTTFKNTPQLPFSDLKLHFFGGERASVSTPPSCGPAPTHGEFVPWSGGAVATPNSTFQVTSGAGDGPCPSSPLPFNPSYTAGVTNTQAGAFTPFTLTLGHADSDQPLERIDVNLPPGIAALISLVSPCLEERALADTCGPESLVGHTTAISGLGDEPVTLGGRVYLTGALKATAGHPAAPFGLLAVTHAAAGPFDLGEVPVFSALEINPSTAAVSVQSEPIPRFVDGVPVDLKQLQVTVERPGDQPFEFNPTSCDPFSITGSLTGYEERSAPLSYPFQVQNCASLPFAPKLTASAGGHGSKANGTNLDVKVESGGVGPTGVAQANIAKVDLTIPAALPSRLTTIQKACPAAVFEANPASCDEGSVIGNATVHTPVLDSPLTGPGYLVSHGGAEFPDVEFVLQGEGIKLVLDGKTDIKKGVTYSRFESTPDAPFTTFETELPAGPHSAFSPNVPEKEDFSLCRTSLSMPTTITGQNGAVIEQDTKVVLTGCSGVEAFKKTKLEEALEACKKKYNKHKDKSKRLACEKRARKKYGPKKAGKKSSSKKK